MLTEQEHNSDGDKRKSRFNEGTNSTELCRRGGVVGCQNSTPDINYWEEHMAATIPTAPFYGYQVLFSPYSPHKLAFTGARNYGIAGENATCKILVGDPRAGKFPWGGGGIMSPVSMHCLFILP